jgi:hypothetical protein
MSTSHTVRAWNFGVVWTGTRSVSPATRKRALPILTVRADITRWPSSQRMLRTPMHGKLSATVCWGIDFVLLAKAGVTRRPKAVYTIADSLLYRPGAQRRRGNPERSAIPPYAVGLFGKALRC